MNRALLDTDIYSSRAARPRRFVRSNFIASKGTMIEEPDRLNLAILISALATWRVTQGIYRFDPSTFDAIRKTPVTGDIPTAVLHHLPEWCVYIPTPGLTWIGASLHGFFAHLEYNAKDHVTQLPVRSVKPHRSSSLNKIGRDGDRRGSLFPSQPCH